MRRGQKVTQAAYEGTDRMRCFTGAITDTPESERGCRTKIAVQADGDARAAWRNWRAGLYRVTCYGDLSDDLRRFCRFKSIQMPIRGSSRAGSELPHTSACARA